MNKEELENYLESIGGLYDWKGRTHTKANIFGVGEGWYGLLKNLIEELLEIGWDRRLNQCKEKFGGLRFYLSTYPEGSDAIISKYESLSYKTCEVCGEEGVLRKASWLTVRCDEHSEGNPPYANN